MESGLCFSVRETFYHLFIFTLLTTIMMIFMNCCITCSLTKGSRSNKVDDFRSNVDRERDYAKKDNKV